MKLTEIEFWKKFLDFAHIFTFSARFDGIVDFGVVIFVCVCVFLVILF